MSITAGFPVDGQLIGPYRVLRRLGGGGMGVVYEAREEALDRPVAVKVIAPHLAEDSEFRTRFIREAQALASLDSPHVVHVYSHDDLDGRLYIATQLIPHGDLGRMIREHGAPPVRVALDLMSQAAAGLADAHAAGFVHRDIKPANVLLRRRDRQMTAYLGDFGVARPLDAAATRTQAGTVGTPSYMAPELHTGGVASVASDVYSLGCLLWATLSGTAPYPGTSEYQIVTAHLEEPVPQLEGDGPLVTEVNRILRTAMAKDPADRYPSAAILRDDLRRAKSLPEVELRGGPVAARPPVPAHSSALVAVGIAVAIALAIGLVAFLASLGGGEESSPVGNPVSATSKGSAPATADLETAEASLAGALVDLGLVTESQAACTAREWIDEAGLEEMAAAGFFDADWHYVDQDDSSMTSGIRNAATTAALECAGS